MSALFPFLLALVSLLLVITAQSAIPLILLALAPGYLKFRFLDPRQADKVLSSSPEIGDALQKLQSLGFDYLGVKVELQLWRKPLNEIATVSAARDAFGSMMLSPEGKLAGIYFFTPLSGGGMVFTRDYDSLNEIETEDTSVKDIPSKDLQELWESHRQRLEVFRQKGLTPLAAHSQESRLEATRHYYNTPYARQIARSYLQSPPVMAFWMMLILLIVSIVVNLSTPAAK